MTLVLCCHYFYAFISTGTVSQALFTSCLYVCQFVLAS